MIMRGSAPQTTAASLPGCLRVVASGLSGFGQASFGQASSAADISRRWDGMPLMVKGLGPSEACP